MRPLSFAFAFALLVAGLPAFAQARIDLNSATQAELEALPGVGPQLAGRIVQDREQNGPFAAPEELGRVPGISSGLIAKLAPLVRAGRRPPPVVLEEGEVVPADVVSKVMARYATEPSVRDVQKAALEYAQAQPDLVASWQWRTRTNALLPQFRTQVDYDIDQDLRKRTNLDATDAQVITEDDDRSYQVQVRAQWDLDRLIFEPQELAVARESVRLANLRDRVLDEVTRRYFERRRLQVDLELSPPTDLADRIRKELRIQELTADIDALTGGWFSSKLVQNPY